MTQEQKLKARNNKITLNQIQTEEVNQERIPTEDPATTDEHISYFDIFTKIRNLKKLKNHK